MSTMVTQGCSSDAIPLGGDGRRSRLVVDEIKPRACRHEHAVVNNKRGVLRSVPFGNRSALSKVSRHHPTSSE